MATATAPDAAAVAAHGSHLFRIRRTFDLETPDDVASSRIVAMAAHALERRQLLALAVASSAHSDDPRANYLLVRSVEEDRRVRHWRFPLAASHAKQQQQRVEPVAALCFAPEGDWLACLSTRKNRLHLVPVATLVAGHRRTQLQRAYQPPHNREWMSAAPSVMTTPMASYLRATNQAGGLNGARYHSRVAGDDAQMSTLEFASGMGTVTCCRWWRSMNGKNYCLVGGSENIISIVNVEDNAEECRCELQNAGRIESIELFYETFRKEKRTSMLVKTKARERDAASKAASGDDVPMTTKYYRVVLEKRTLEKTPKQKPDSSSEAVSKGGDAASTSSTQDEPSPASSFTRYMTRPSSASESYVIKTFPDHFVEDMDFRPQRIKKNKPDVRLSAINGLLSSESGLAMYDASSQQVSVYSNFQWSLKGQYAVPSIARANADDSEPGAVVDVDIAYCSSDLMLLQGKDETTDEFVSTWVSLPSRQVFGDEQSHTQDQAHVVHYLSLHDNERVENVLQTRSGTQSTPDATAGEVIYVIQTAHNVYECRPQWSRLALFRALRGRTIGLRDALSIGYALGIDMPSLCEVVADTLCGEELGDAESNDEGDDQGATRQWVHDLFEVSRAAPSKAVEQLARIKASTLAIEYAKRVLADSLAGAEEDAPPLSSGGGRGTTAMSQDERHRVSLQVVDLILQEQAQNSFSADPDNQLTLRPRDSTTELQLTRNEAWLGRFLRSASDEVFSTLEMVDLCLSHHQTEKAVVAAVARAAAPIVLQRMAERGQVATLALPSGKPAVQSLIAAGYASYLLEPEHRLILRSLSSETQLDVLLATASLGMVLQHRDWILRHLGEFSTRSCVELAALVDRQAETDEDEDELEMTHRDIDEDGGGDVASSEFMEATESERVELFLTLLLRINSDTSFDESGRPPRFSQASLETLLRELAFQYRPPIMIARCVDYENWSAAASLHEAHGELVDAVECRLHSHQKLIQKQRGATSNRRRKSSKESLAEEEEEDASECREDEETADSDDDLGPLREELIGMIDALVIRTPTHTHTLPVKSTPIVTTATRAAILARVLVKWFEYGLPRAALEIYLIDSKVFADVAAPLAQIFFSEIVDRVGVKGLHPSATAASAGCFDERDKAWVRRCHTLPFSGQFLFHVCMWPLDHHQPKPLASATTDNQVQPQAQLLSVVKENIEKNDLAIRAVRIEPQSAQAIGKSDPLETHVKAFSCGHLFPKRVFDEDVLPEFEKRMNALPTPLFATKQLLLGEFKRSHVESPCPVCAFNKISVAVFHQLALKDNQQRQKADHEPSAMDPTTPQPPPALYFLHRSSLGPPTSTPSPFASSPNSPSNRRKTERRKHDEWEWRSSADSSNRP